jgi:chemotaxis protein MotB
LQQISSTNVGINFCRSTTIIRVLTEGKLDPARITAAGHGEYFPIADNKTKDGRAKNRRTEIILTPNLDEIQKLIDQN